VIADLSRLIQEAYNHTSDDESYVLWVGWLETRFNEWFTAVRPELLHSDRYWQISSGGGLRTHERRRQECERVVGLLSRLHDTLQELAERFGQGHRTLAVVDTNVLLHHRPISDVCWTDVVGADTVTLVIPVRVLAEIDDKKAAPNNPPLRKRARTRSKNLAAYALGAWASSPVRDGVEVTFVESVDLDPDVVRETPRSADTEILDSCIALRSYAAKNAVYLVTADLALMTRARTRGVEVREMPETDYLPLGEASED
jgi:rRNA-processing protein FCF1